MTLAPRTALALLLAASATTLPCPLAGQRGCQGPEHRAFDFWLGSWEVTAGGRLAGHNTIRSVMGGCVLHERYTTPRGYEGESFNLYDASRGVWHQTWVDNGGTLLTLEGGLSGNAMVLRGEGVGPDGAPTLQRITWSRVEGDADRVRQHWEASRDGGASWSTVFDGLYTRVEEGAPGPDAAAVPSPAPPGPTTTTPLPPPGLPPTGAGGSPPDPGAT